MLSAPALALDTGPPNVANLPPDNAARKSYEDFERDRGAGWATPFEVDLHTQRADHDRAAAARLKRFQLAGRAANGVEAVLGPASLLDRTAVLRRLTRQIATGRAAAHRSSSAASRRLLRGAGALDRGLEAGAQGARRR